MILASAQSHVLDRIEADPMRPALRLAIVGRLRRASLR